VSKRFTFPLARVLRHRQRLEDARALAVRQAIEQHEAARTRQATIEHAAETARSALTQDCATTGMTGAWIRLHADGVSDLHGRARAAAILPNAEAARVEERRAELVDAARARKALERLEELQRSAWQADVLRTDQRTTDDIATTRHRRNG
jgi:flagellar export protein FliJ